LAQLEGTTGVPAATAFRNLSFLAVIRFDSFIFAGWWGVGYRLLLSHPKKCWRATHVVIDVVDTLGKPHVNIGPKHWR